MKNNFIEICNEAIKEINELNLETIKDFDISYAECFPIFISRKINIDNKDYGMNIEIKLKEL